MSESLSLLHEHIVSASKWLGAALSTSASTVLVHRVITRQLRVSTIPDRLAVATDVDQVDKPLILAARPDFQHCPLEILSEIVSYLDLGDVLRLRQVCDILSIWQR